jgi:hypothetical protein
VLALRIFAVKNSTNRRAARSPAETICTGNRASVPSTTTRSFLMVLEQNQPVNLRGPWPRRFPFARANSALDLFQDRRPLDCRSRSLRRSVGRTVSRTDPRWIPLLTETSDPILNSVLTHIVVSGAINLLVMVVGYRGNPRLSFRMISRGQILGLRGFGSTQASLARAAGLSQAVVRKEPGVPAH